jgi:hypothetical protein
MNLPIGYQNEKDLILKVDVKPDNLDCESSNG